MEYFRTARLKVKFSEEFKKRLWEELIENMVKQSANPIPPLEPVDAPRDP